MRADLIVFSHLRLACQAQSAVQHPAEPVHLAAAVAPVAPIAHGALLGVGGSRGRRRLGSARGRRGAGSCRGTGGRRGAGSRGELFTAVGTDVHAQVNGRLAPRTVMRCLDGAGPEAHGALLSRRVAPRRRLTQGRLTDRSRWPSPPPSCTALA